MAIYDLEKYKQNKINNGEMSIKKTGFSTWKSKLQLKICLPIAIVGLTYIMFIGFASILIRWPS